MDDNRIVMECYYNSEPGRNGYKKRMHSLWISRGMFPVTEQRLVDQKNQITKKKWLSNLKLEEIKRSIEDASYGQREQGIQHENRDEEIVDHETDVGHEGANRNVYFSVDEEVTDEDKNLIERLNEISKKDRVRLPSLRGVEKGKLYAAVKNVDNVIGKIKVNNITETNDLIYCGAAMVTEMLGVKSKNKEKRKEPWWKRRLEGQVKELNRDLGRVNALINRKAVKKKDVDSLQGKYKVKQNGLQIVKEELRQRIKAKHGKITSMSKEPSNINRIDSLRTTKVDFINS